MRATKLHEWSVLCWWSDPLSGGQDAKKTFSAILAAGVLTASLTGAQATPVFFTDEAAFQSSASAAGIGGLPVEGFEGLADGTAAPFTVGTLTVSPSAGTLGTIFDFPSFATEGTNILGWNNASATSKTMTFVLAEPIFAFGIDVIDLGDSSPPGTTGPVPATLILTVGASTQVLFSNYTGADGNVLFAGVVDATNPFSSVTFELANVPQGDFIAFDRVQSFALSEPTTLALLGISLGVLALRRQKRAVH